MPAIPENIRPALALVAKHHFWILALLVPLVVLPAVFLAGGSVQQKISAQRSQIEGKKSTAQSVTAEGNHPHESWAKAVDEETKKIDRSRLAEWNQLWATQEPLRAWPDAIGGDFITALQRLSSGKELAEPYRRNFMNKVADLVRELPERMGAAEMMADGEGQPAGRGLQPGPRPGGGRGFPGRELGGGPGMGGEEEPRLVVWDAGDQKRVYDSFALWMDEPPSTRQILLAHEELCGYRLLCDVIGKANADALGAFNAPVALVEELAIGYPAAEEKVGGEGTGRVLQQAGSPGGFGEGETGEGAAMTMGADGMGEAAGGRPSHPRFVGLAGGERERGGPGMMIGGEGGEGAGEAASLDEGLQQWIYVDFAGKPLTAAELETSPDAEMVHLMPFTLRMVIDQRRIDEFLTLLATAPAPVDVRQVRINPEAAAGIGGGRDDGGGRPGRGPGLGPRGGGGLAPRGGPGPGPRPGSRMQEGAGMESGGLGRPFDVQLELRGTLGLARRPPQGRGRSRGAAAGDEAGGEESATEAAEGSEPAATQESAA